MSPGKVSANAEAAALASPWMRNVLNLLFALCVPVVGYLCSQVIENERTIAVLESTRFTAADGAKLRDEQARLWQAYSRLPSEIPPKWFLDRIDKMEVRFERILEAQSLSIKNLETRVSQISRK